MLTACTPGLPKRSPRRAPISGRCTASIWPQLAAIFSFSAVFTKQSSQHPGTVVASYHQRFDDGQGNHNVPNAADA
jgi:hypothetical protein